MSLSDEVPIRLADLYPVQLFIRFNLKILSIEFIWDLEKCSMIYIKTGLPKYKMKLTYMKYIWLINELFVICYLINNIYININYYVLKWISNFLYFLHFF